MFASLLKGVAVHSEAMYQMRCMPATPSTAGLPGFEFVRGGEQRLLSGRRGLSAETNSRLQSHIDHGTRGILWMHVARTPCMPGNGRQIDCSGTAPLLVLHGDRDRSVPLENGQVR